MTSFSLCYITGLASFEFAISDDPIHGMWKITGIVEGKRILRLFDVKEYGRCCQLLTRVIIGIIIFIRTQDPQACTY